MVPIDLYVLYQLMLATLNTQQGGHLRPVRNFLQWVNEISKELFNEKVDEWEKTQKIDDALAISFLVSRNVRVQPNPGRGFETFAYPQDYAYFSSARVLINDESGAGCELPKADCVDCNTGKIIPYVDPDDAALAKLAQNVNYRERNVLKVDNQRWGAAFTHKLKSPTVEKPVLTQFDGGFKIAPAMLGIVVLDYLKRPRDAVFNYTVDMDDQIVYNAVGSVQLEWTDMVMPEFVARLKKRYASYTEQPQKYQEAELERKINK